MLQLTISFALFFFSLGLDQTYVREFHEIKDKSTLLKAVFFPGFFIIKSIFNYSFFNPCTLSSLLFSENSLVLEFIVYIAILASFFLRYLSLILRMQERGLAYSMSQLLPKLLFLSIVLFYVITGMSASFEKLIIASSISILAVFLYLLGTLVLSG